MLLLHQTGSVHVGEVVRYTLTYTPSLDRILPPPTHLHVKIKNTSAIPLRAAYLHGPYTLYVACYPSTFNPYQKHEAIKEEGAPEYEPQLKAGGHWTSRLTVPEETRGDALHTESKRNGERKSFTWIIEVASQIIFSKTASVHYELLVGRDQKSVDSGLHGVVGSGQRVPGRLEDHQQGRSRNAAQSKGVFSKAVRLAVDDTESLWNTPPFPSWDDNGDVKVEQGPQHGDKRDHAAKKDKKQRKQKKIHLVLLTHGLHSNLGADMLFMKETIDTTAKIAREDAKKRRAERRAERMAEANKFGRDRIDQKSKSVPEPAVSGGEGDAEEETDDEDEQVIVRGFNGNAVRTERGIQYLGKRFAKYVLSITYPDQPYLPVKSSIGRSLTKSLPGVQSKPPPGTQLTHKNSSIVKDEGHRNHNLAYRITSISFISHSLGGLIQTYAIAYIQKHSPDFFDIIKPINFVAMASPFLGLSNENPVYVKFALDFGLVGRTGQDLGLTWRPPTIAKNGWGAVIGSLTNDSQKAQREHDPGAKPLLRILPTGPAHVALKKFRNRTVYSNVVNDGIVPLRTSCLLFLDWRGLGRVEKARRESGLVGTMVEWGWHEMTGQNASAVRKPIGWNDLFGDSADEVSSERNSSPDPGASVPQAEASQGFDYEQRVNSKGQPPLDKAHSGTGGQLSQESSETSATNLWSGLLNLFKPHAGEQKPAPKVPRKAQKIYHRGQTMHQLEQDSETSSQEDNHLSVNHAEEQRGGSTDGRSSLVRGSSLYTNTSGNPEVEAPPKTTFFESAGDLLNPPLPPKEFILNPSTRPRTIFHDRVYHPTDIPPPPAKRQRTLMPRRTSAQQTFQHAPSPLNDDARRGSIQSTASNPEPGSMRIEEKIARAYHKDLSWRKVLVRLEPDAHNNMIVRRMFANAYGWPVVKHMCDTHFAYTAAAQTRDEDEPAVERAIEDESEFRAVGEEVKGQTDLPPEEVEDENMKEQEKHSGPQRAQTDDEVAATSASPQSPNGNKMPTRWKVQDRLRPERARTESEIRESRDDVSELLSKISAAGESSKDASYSSMNSSRAALSRLARSDSSRWSDRFFEGSDDGEEEDEDDPLVEELRKAERRGELDNASDSTITSPKIATVLTSSPQSTRLNLAKDKDRDVGAGEDERLVTEPETPLTAEPAELEPLSHSSGANTPRQEQSEELAPSAVPTSTGAGLGLSLAESAGASRAGVVPPVHGEGDDTDAGQRPLSRGVAEQVALAKAKGETRNEGED
ncbi:putative serine esterase-domain-containing protein [Exophiala viscosa]|uniref:putative serine esterase-domain-containing protein n=1 Tax=Exophiala viscosa TaxID=2486360 RepID=UPI0021A165B3|nr:putative serine esterase-domain-containing protein [Exophiala viscosa]